MKKEKKFKPAILERWRIKKLQTDRQANCLRLTGPFKTSLLLHSSPFVLGIKIIWKNKLAISVKKKKRLVTMASLPTGRAVVGACLACAESRMCCAHMSASLALPWQEDAGGSGVQGQPVSKISK